VFFERLGANFEIHLTGEMAAGAKHGKSTREPDGTALSKLEGMAFLDDKQLRQLLEAAQEDRHYTVLQAPKLTVFSGQRACVNIADTQFFLTVLKAVQKGDQVVVVPKNEAIETGLRFLIQPAVSADRRFVRMNFRADLTELESPAVPLVPVTTHLKRKTDGEGREQVVPVQQFVQQPTFRKMKVDKSFVVADGKTAVLHWGKRLVEGRNEFGPPVLSEVPYLGRLFRNVGYARETETLVLLITPRVIISNEEEEQPTAYECIPAPQP
jgi:Flp pilus assembly secretin CpaC